MHVKSPEAECWDRNCDVRRGRDKEATNVLRSSEGWSGVIISEEPLSGAHEFLGSVPSAGGWGWWCPLAHTLVSVGYMKGNIEC